MVRVGTSGWHYDSWRGRFYPDRLATRKWLSYYAEQFGCVESNAAFYRLPTVEQFRAWADQTPDDFVFAVKVSRYLSHVRRLRAPADPVHRFLARTKGLGDKHAVSLLQLPPTLRHDRGLLDGVLRAFPTKDHRLAIEFRHESWFRDDVAATLASANVALCLTDRKNRHPEPEWATADWGYVRLHEGTADPSPCYGTQAIRSWMDRIDRLWPGGDAFVFFNNDPQGCAVANARTAVRSLERSGHRTR